MGKDQKKASAKEGVKPAKKAPAAAETGSSKEHLRVQKELAELKAAKSKAWSKVQNVVLTQKLKKGDMPKDKAMAKAYKADRATYDDLKAQYEKLEAKEKSLRPARAEKTKYTYPASIADDPAEKKRFRARMRTLADKGITGKEAEKMALEAGKPDGKKTKAKDEVTSKKSKAPEAAPAKSKDGKKKKKKKKSTKED